ncbi:MAG: hypothetical protein U5O15_00960 [Candidatus Krumholzibacteriota bacterium]|nr:hypothetical protein [Candidatus Krumholzibacteriota bacterium]
MDNINKIREFSSKLIVGIETGSIPERLAAVAAEVKGHGDSTVLNLIYYTKRSFPEDLQKMLLNVVNGHEIGAEEKAGINFLVLHHLASLYRELLDEAGLERKDVNLVGLKCMEIADDLFPKDPAAFSGIIDRIVASHFTIDIEGKSESLTVGETILKELVTEMIDKLELDTDAREAVGVALLANEALYYEKVGASVRSGGDSGEVSPGVNISRGVGTDRGEGKTVLNGKFFFPY